MKYEDLDKLARAGFERYKEHCRKEGIPVLYESFDEQPQTLIDSCFAQASDIERKINSLGLVIRPLSEGFPNRIEVLTDDSVEVLAVEEHNRWMAERLADGWTLGAIKDPERKITPDLIPWEELTEVKKDFDRRPVRDIIWMLRGIGLGIYAAEM